MDPRERALTVRLLEKAVRHPEYVKKLGLEIAARPSGETGEEPRGQ